MQYTCYLIEQNTGKSIKNRFKWRSLCLVFRRENECMYIRTYGRSNENGFSFIQISLFCLCVNIVYNIKNVKIIIII
ncbi:hypothetical protein V1477_018855 [Vespula maculifrons]|uniref:Uncharacterized protein n=1 Tax=Vespula maculifrons TaxID=7453 RepID=A0ABD2AWK5_VESMC